MYVKILFVCLGNICRSPMAEAVLKKYVNQQGLEQLIYIDSAGTYAGHQGELPDQRMREAAKQRGYSLTHRSRPVQIEDFEKFDMLIAMDDANYHRLKGLSQTIEQEKKIFKMAHFCKHFKVDHIPDPYYGGLDGFTFVIDLLEDACCQLLIKIKEKYKD